MALRTDRPSLTTSDPGVLIPEGPGSVRPMPPGSTDEEAPGAPGALNPLGLVVLLIGVFLPMTDFFIVNVALPTIDRNLLASQGMLQLVVAGYSIAYALLLV